MNKQMEPFYPPPRLLLGPGPSSVHPRVLQAMAMPLLGHLDGAFLKVMDDVMQSLRDVFKTSNKLTFPVSATGSAGMEAAFCNILEPGDVAVVAVNGFFGNRMVDIGNRCGAEVHSVEYEWGKAIGPDLSRLEDEMKKHKRVKAVAIVHGETSTGVLNSLKPVADLAHAYDAVVIADTVTSLGGVNVALDEWDVDVGHSGTQKCLGGPPGLAPVTLGPRAEQVLKERTRPVQSFYLNLSDLETYWDERRAYHHTAPISMVYALREALRMVQEEGLEARFARHALNARAFRAGAEALGMNLLADPDARLDPLTTVLTPEGVDVNRVRGILLEEYGIEIGGGLGPLAGKILRIGLMGDGSRAANVLLLLSALERILPKEGFEVANGAGVAAAQKVYAEED